MHLATFCYWRRVQDQSWSKVEDNLANDGSEKMLALLISGSSGYKAWAEDYFETSVPLESVEFIFSHQPLSDSLVFSLNPEADLESIYAEAAEIGYPRNVA
jgi:hypothetical protein